MQKRNGTPSLSYRIGLIPHPKKKQNSKGNSKLILPLLKDNMDENASIKNEEFLCQKMPSSKETRNNKYSIEHSQKKFLSPIHTDLNKMKKRGSRCEQNSSKFLLKIKGKSSNQIIKIKEKSHENSKEKNPKRINNFNKNNKKKNLDKIKTENFPVICSSKNDSKLKFPLIETNLMKNDKKINNNKFHHKFNSDNLLYSENIFRIKKEATYSEKGTEENGKLKENNQDMSIILNNVVDDDDYNIYGIMDGHGSNGHLVSNFVKEKIVEYFNNKKIYKSKKLTKALSSLHLNDISEKIYEKLVNNNYEIIRHFYQKVNDELYNTKFDIHFSGTTCILVFKIGKKIICSNVGDSRAILVKKNLLLSNNNKQNNIKYEFIELSHDHKPNNQEEKERIEKLGGEVAQEYYIGEEKEQGPTGPFRVWCKGYDYPGIAISRSLGDKIAELIGVISEPDILEFDIDDNCKYILMGSDGLFDYLSNNDIMNIARPFLNKNNLDKACIEVVENASKLFKEKEGRIDDITINIIKI